MRHGNSYNALHLMEVAHHLSASPDVSGFATPAVVSVVLFPSFSLMALASTTEPLRAANLLSGKTLYQWSLVSVGSREVRSSSGFRLTTDHSDLALPPSDLTLVIASLEFDHLLQPSLLRRLPTALRASKAIGAVSHGSIVLARAGLRDGYRCTTHWDRLKEL